MMSTRHFHESEAVENYLAFHALVFSFQAVILCYAYAL